MNQCSIVLQSHNWTPVSSDIAIEGSIAIQGCSSRVPSLAYFYGVEIFSMLLHVRRAKTTNREINELDKKKICISPK